MHVESYDGDGGDEENNAYGNMAYFNGYDSEAAWIKMRLYSLILISTCFLPVEYKVILFPTVMQLLSSSLIQIHIITESFPSFL